MFRKYRLNRLDLRVVKLEAEIEQLVNAINNVEEFPQFWISDLIEMKGKLAVLKHKRDKILES